MHLQRSATAGPPHDAYIPNQTILIVAQPARRIFIGNKPAVIVDYRISIDVKKRTSLTDLDIFVADTAKQCDIRGNRDSYIGTGIRSEEHTSEIQSIMRISYAVFCLKKKNNN